MIRARINFLCEHKNGQPHLRIGPHSFENEGSCDECSNRLRDVLRDMELALTPNFYKRLRLLNHVLYLSLVVNFVLVIKLATNP